jgi:hypothetical protein
MFSQCFGDSREFNAEIDYVSALAFDKTGCYLATGDNAGRVVLFNRIGSSPPGRHGGSAASKGTADTSSCPICASSNSSSSSGSTSSEASVGIYTHIHVYLDMYSHFHLLLPYIMQSMDEFKGSAGSRYAELDMPTLYSSSCSACKCEIFGDSTTTTTSGTNNQDWTVYHQFQSHEVEFDYLKSLEINQRINCIEWCMQSCPQKISLLSANGINGLICRYLPRLASNYVCVFFLDKCVKLWSISERIVEDTKPSTGTKHSYVRNGELHIRAPKLGKFYYDSKSASVMTRYSNSTEYSNRCGGTSYKSESNGRVYNNAHAYHINSLSANSDCETFISADDLRINWWNLEYPDQCFSKFTFLMLRSCMNFSRLCCDFSQLSWTQNLQIWTTYRKL